MTSSGGASTDAGGATANGGTVGAGGTTDPCAPKTCSTTTDCTASAATQALLTDFSNNAGEWHGTDTEWWTKLFGGTYVYPALDACAATQPTYPLTQDFTGGSWHITGTVGTYSGIGMWFSPCMADFSAYKGISFTIGGNVGTKGTVVFAVATAATTEKTATTCSPNTATCVKPTATGTTPAPDACVAASKTVTVASAGTTVTVLWTDLTGGLTSGGTAAGALNPATITGMSWTLDWNWQYTTTNNYSVDLTIDNIQLVQ